MEELFKGSGIFEEHLSKTRLVTLEARITSSDLIEVFGTGRAEARTIL